MNKLVKVVCCLVLTFIVGVSTLDAQVYDRRGQAIYIEFAGQGFPFSLNYETRFAEKTEGLGARIGVGYEGEWLYFPVNINFLLGKKDKSHFLELGAGATFYYYPEPELLGGELLDYQVVGAFTIMYRLHPRYGKFFFKVGLTPLIGYFSEDQESIETIPMFGIAFGRAF